MLTVPAARYSLLAINMLRHHAALLRAHARHHRRLVHVQRTGPLRDPSHLLASSVDLDDRRARELSRS